MPTLLFVVCKSKPPIKKTNCEIHTPYIHRFAKGLEAIARRHVNGRPPRAVAAIEVGPQEKLYLGNLDARRDWGHARDYVEGMWLILQQAEPDDYVLATGEAHSVREFVEKAFAHIGRKIVWQGNDVSEVGIESGTNRVLVEVDPRYFRPIEVDCLIGDASRARRKLGWKHKISFDSLVAEMVEEDLKLLRNSKQQRKHHE